MVTFWNNLPIENKIKYIRLFAIASLVITFDQVTKFVILNTMPLYHSITVIPGCFNIVHIHNPGGAFGVFATQSDTVRKILFLVISSFAACFVLYFYNRTPRNYPLLASGFALIFGGAIGNIIDRIYLGKVVDFLDFYIGPYHWPTFNVADSAITVGVGLLLFQYIFRTQTQAVEETS